MAGYAQKALSFEDLIVRREKTERVSEFLARRLRGHLSVLYPAVAPKRVFGKHVGAREEAPRADEAMAQLSEKFREVCGRPFDLRPDLDQEALSAMEHGIELYAWEYTHVITSRQDAKSITVTSPVRWVLTFRSDYTFAQVRSVLSGKGERRGAALRHFVVNALAAQIALSRTPGLISLLEDLRYNVRPDHDPALGKLPLLTIESAVPSFRPDDELILKSTSFSGVPSFIEVVDEDAVRSMEDPFRAQLESLLQ